MSYLGKVYKHVKDENYDGFVRSLPIPEDTMEATIKSKPSIKLDKKGDEYTLSIINPDAAIEEVVFKSGVEFEKAVMDDKITLTMTVKDNVVTGVQKMSDITITFVREYSGDELVETATNSSWNGSARRYYSAK